MNIERRIFVARTIACGLVSAAVVVVIPGGVGAQDGQRPAPRTVGEIIAAAADAEWRALDPDDTVYLELPTGRVVLELAPEFAPRHVENIRALVRGGYFDGGAVRRSQDNYVAQWSVRQLGEGETRGDDIAASLAAEFEMPADRLPFTPLIDGDVFAPEVGYFRGFPAARDPASGVAWMAHCYGVVGVARGTDPDSGSGAALYMVSGHSPRHLDRNLSMVGRVVAGAEHLSALPRGTGNLGFYEAPQQGPVFTSVRMGTDVPAEERAQFEIMRTDSDSFRELVLAARSRTDEFFVYPADRIGLCNVRVPTRPIGAR